jgi:hypothetical protein
LSKALESKTVLASADSVAKHYYEGMGVSIYLAQIKLLYLL